MRAGALGRSAAAIDIQGAERDVSRDFGRAIALPVRAKRKAACDTG
jgi:hypothetical protein